MKYKTKYYEKELEIEIFKDPKAFLEYSYLTNTRFPENEKIIFSKGDKTCREAYVTFLKGLN